MHNFGWFTRAILIAAILVLDLFVLGEPAQAHLTASPVSVNFAPQIIGTASTPINIILTNSGEREDTLVSVSLSQAVFSFSALPLPLTLAPNQSLVVTVNFSPSVAQAYSDTLVFTRDTGWTTTVALSGTGIPPAPTITAQPLSESVIAGQTATFTASAASAVPMSYQWLKNGVAIGGATSPAYTTPATTSSDSGAQFSIVATNSTGSTSSAAATLTVIPATYLLNPSSTTLSLGNVTLPAATSQSMTFTSDGNSPVTIANVSVSGAGFTASGVSAGIILPAGQSVALNVAFAPAASGSVTGSITVTSNATNSPALITLSGVGVAPVPPSVLVSWTPSVSVVSGYNTYSSAVSGGPYTRLNTSLTPGAAYTDNTVVSGSTYYYVVTAVDSNNVESVFSNETSATVP